jgi:hypothetical protein
MYLVRESLQNSLPAAPPRPRAVQCVAFLGNSPAVGRKNRLVAHPDAHQRILARVMQKFLKSKSLKLRQRFRQLQDLLAAQINGLIFQNI